MLPPKIFNRPRSSKAATAASRSKQGRSGPGPFFAQVTRANRDATDDFFGDWNKENGDLPSGKLT